jgi:tetratricopeptide (TPR) repeat protein
LAIRLKSFGAEHPEVGRAYREIGISSRNLGDYNKAFELLEKCLAIWLKVVGAEHLELAVVYDEIGEVFRDKGENNKALEFYEKSLSIYLNNLGKEHKIVVNFAKSLIKFSKDNGLTALIPDWIRSLDS